MEAPGATNSPPESSAPRASGAPGVFVAILSGVTGACLSPPIFESVFSADPPGHFMASWINCGILLGLALAVFLLRRRLPGPLLALIFGLLLVPDLELGCRLAALNAFTPETMQQMERARREVSHNNIDTTYMGHPFLHYTGTQNRGDFNHLGFTGNLPTYHKTKGVVRVACLGGSTTAFGLVEEIDKVLNSGNSGKFEILNFALAGWASVHSLVNLVLNVVDFAPDYLVVHHGWNDQETCKVSCARGDYSHKYQLKNLRTLTPMERFLIQSSYIYRTLILDRLNEWIAPISDMTAKEYGPCPEDLCGFGGSEYHYRRNLETMVHVAMGRGMTLIFATMPHSTHPPEDERHKLPEFDKTNGVMRDVADKYKDQVILVDLDRLMTGKFDKHFTDLGHMDFVGKRFKAAAIGEAIQGHLKRSASGASPSLGASPEPPE